MKFTESYLSHWREAKQHHLRKMLGGNLTIEIPFQSAEMPVVQSQISEEYSRLIKHIALLLMQHYTNKDATQFYDNFSFIDNNHVLEDIPQFRVKAGEKKIKALRKYINLICINHDYTPQFRKDLEALLEVAAIRYSQAKNLVNIYGTLVLSIDPEDYIHMSDNTTGWTACTSWDNSGEYIAGTLELMNSPNTLIAYIKDSKGLKKWRGLVVADEHILAMPQSYPFTSPSLNAEVLNEVRSLMEENLQWNYLPPQECRNYSPTMGILDEATGNNYSFWTNLMYNDFYAHNFCSYCLRETNEKHREFQIIYSKPAYCITCETEELIYSDHEECQFCGGYEAEDDDYIWEDEDEDE